ncbi:hypothetical protein [Paenarthrobacter sp. CM16]|uniref:hypothetical protein n=1 Tax=Paenarthrobacter sp. CM16 TaxID=2738447 RepID=UPI0020A61DCE|nr:hypothetical protein [Paenarthrobacter sp. CM16]
MVRAQFRRSRLDYDVALGAGTGRVDDVSKHQELLWVILEPTGRKLICGTDDVQVWTV